ncbi:MAG: pyridoxamine 5'-phosphate oxidase family protein [Anaerolineae bacterium]|nr:pyridoxamine 5'-phosphate oxidase family protein [Anaerolineae bacterium]
MLDDQAREFLQKRLIARMSTVGPDGYPHTVPVWFKLEGDDIIIISTRDTRKVQHILANSKGAVTIGGDPNDGAGYLLQGDFSVEEDTDRIWLRTLTYYYEEKEQAEKDIAAWQDLDMIAIRLKPKKVVKVF